MRPAPEAEYLVVKTLAHDGGDRRQFRVGLVRLGEKRFLEARVYYRDIDGEARPTKKGVVVTPSNFLALSAVLDAKNDEIRQWLGLSHTPEDVSAAIVKQSVCVSRRDLPELLFWTFSSSGNSSSPYSVEYEGARVTVVFNLKNAWVSGRVRNCDHEATHAIAELIVAEDLARRVANRDSDGDEFDGVFGLVDIHRGIMLNTARREPK